MEYFAAPAPWATNGPTEIGPGQIVVRWTHPGGAIVDDNTRNLPADLLADLGPELCAEAAWVGWHGNAWEEFPTFEAAALWAVEGKMT